MQKFLQIKNQTSSSADIYFYGDIVSDEWGKWSDTDTCPDDVRKILDEVNGVSNLNLYVNSGGGSVFAGLAIYNMLKRNTANKTAYIDGLAGSIASIIPMAANKIIIPSNAFFMIHKPWNIIMGNSNDFRKMADDLDRIEGGIINVYAENLADGVDIQTIKDMVNAETWLNGIEASKYFNVEVAQANNVAACVSDSFKNYKNVPKEILDSNKDNIINKFDETEKLKLQLQLELL